MYIGAIADYKYRAYRYTRGQWILGIAGFVLFLIAYTAYNYVLYRYSSLLIVWKLIFYVACTIAYFGICGASIAAGVDSILHRSRVDTGIALINLSVCTTLFVLMFYIDYYPRILLLCSIDIEAALAMVSLIGSLRRVNYYYSDYKLMLILVITGTIAYNALLFWYRMLIVYKVLAYTVAIAGAIALWVIWRPIRLPYFIGLATGGSYLYYAYVL